MDSLIVHSGILNDLELLPASVIPDSPDADAVKRAIPRNVDYRGRDSDMESTEIQAALFAAWSMAESYTRQIWTTRDIEIKWTGDCFQPPFNGQRTISQIQYFDPVTKGFVDAAGSWSLDGRELYVRDEAFDEFIDWKFRLVYVRRDVPLPVQTAVQSLAAFELVSTVISNSPEQRPNTPVEAALSVDLSPGAQRGDPFRATSAGVLLAPFVRQS